MIAVLERNSQSTAVLSYINLKNRKEVLKILQKTDGTKILQYVDTNYWKIFSNNKQITDFDVSIFKDLDITVDISTRDNTLNLLNFKNSKKIAAE